jgi:UDP-glucose 4-epimerase
MADKKVILVTGAASYWGARIAAKLVAEPGLHVIGLDVEPPAEKIKGLDFIQADIRNPLLVDLLKQEEVDTLCHLNFIETARPSETAFDLNVMGTVRVFGACVEAGVRKIALKSSTAVYGAHPDNPAFLTEEHPLRGSRRYGYTRDMVEIEAFCNGFRRQSPDIQLTILRFPSIIGPTADTPMTRFLKELWTPTLMGFDPMMQIIHEDDVVNAMAHVIVNDAPGVFNVAAEGAMPLWKLMALAGKPPIPVLHLLVYWGTQILGETGLRVTRYAPIELDYIRYTWVADLARMREQLGFAPHYTAVEALREFAGRQRMRRYLPESVTLAYDEERLRATLERRRRLREQYASAANTEEDNHD